MISDKGASSGYPSRTNKRIYIQCITLSHAPKCAVLEYYIPDVSQFLFTEGNLCSLSLKIFCILFNPSCVFASNRSTRVGVLEDARTSPHPSPIYTRAPLISVTRYPSPLNSSVSFSTMPYLSSSVVCTWIVGVEI